MGAGGPGDNPITDILNHGLEPYPLDMCIFIQLLDDKGIRELEKSGVEYWHWQDNIDVEEGRKYLHDLFKRKGTKPRMAGKPTDLILKIARSFYKLGLSDKEIRAVYWEISEKYFGFAEKKDRLKGNDKVIYSKLRS